MLKIIGVLIAVVSFSTFAIEICNECHDEKWQQTPAHVWIDTQHHLDVVSCMDCHRWKEGDDLPPELPRQVTLNEECGQCHQTPEDLPGIMHMAQRS